MIRNRRLVAAFAAATAIAAPPRAGDRLSFVSCPMVRDTRTVPCWLAQHEGETYFLTLQTDVSAPVNPPWLGHRVLVEGVVSDEPRICGGRVIKPVTLSVLPELDASCNVVLPAEDRYELAFEPPRPPGPSRGRLAFGDPVMREAAAAREFTLAYEFDGKVAFRHAQVLQRILDTARAAGATEVHITGYRSASPGGCASTCRETATTPWVLSCLTRDHVSGPGVAASQRGQNAGERPPEPGADRRRRARRHRDRPGRLARHQARRRRERVPPVHLEPRRLRGR